MTAPTPKIKSRKPTGQVPFPMVLLEGEEKAGKTYQIALLSASERVGDVYWFDLGEGSADEYGALEGADFNIIEHDGSYADILAQLTAVWHEAKRAADAGEKPVVVGVDSMSALWRMLTAWTNDRARRSKTGQKKLREDPDAEIDVPFNLWNDANGRHRRVLDLLESFPGIAVITARGKEIIEVSDDGRPVKNSKVWKVEGQKELSFEASVWVRMFRSPRRAQLIGGRGLQLGQMDGEPVDLPDFTLDGFIFDYLGLAAKGATTRNTPTLKGDALQGLVDEVQACETEDALKALYEERKKGLRPEDIEVLNWAVTERLEVLRRPADETPADEDESKATQHTDAEKLAAAAKRKAAEDKPDAA